MLNIRSVQRETQSQIILKIYTFPRHVKEQATVASACFVYIFYVQRNVTPTKVTDVCVRLFCVCVVLCVGSGLATGSSPVQGVLPSV
jgi:hypothetical protein